MASKSSFNQTLSLVFPLFIPSFIFTFSFSLLIPVLPLYAKSFNVTYSLVGVVLAGQSIGMLLGDLPAGMLLRKLGQKGSMLLGILITAVMATVLYWVTSIYVVILCEIIAGAGSALFSVSRHFFLVEMVAEESRGRIISAYGGVFRLGRFLGPIAGGAVAVAYGLRSSFLIFGAACLVALVVLFFFVPSIEVPQPEVQSGSNGWTTFWGMLAKNWKILATTGFGALFLQMIRSGPPVIFPLFGADILSLDVAQIGWVMSLAAGLEMLVFLPAGWVMDHWGRKAAIISSCAILALGVGLVPFSQSLGMLLLAALLTGFGGGMGSGGLLTLGSDLAPKAGRGEFLGTWTLIGDMGATAAPLIIGFLADSMPLPPTAWVISVAGILAGLVFFFFVPETLRKSPQARV